MKRKNEAATTGCVQQLKRRRHTPPNTCSPSEKQHTPSSREASAERITDWLSSLPESPLSLAAAAAVASPDLGQTPELPVADKMPSDAASSPVSTRPARSQAPSSHASGASRSSSLSKLSTQNYRAQVLRRLDIHVDAETPVETLRKLQPPSPKEGCNQETIEEVARELYVGARKLLERQTANEAEWVALLTHAIDGLMRDLPDRLCCLPNRDWQAALKPVAYTHRLTSTVPKKRTSSTALSAQAGSPNDTPRDPDYPTPDHTHSPVHSQSTADLLANRPEMPPPTAQRLKLEPAPARLQPKTPRPDLSVGLNDSDAAWAADEAFWTRSGLHSKDVKAILTDLQAAPATPDSGPPLITDPCTATPSGLRFPFFMVEVKSGGSSSIADAENQSAVSAACALRILRALGGGDLPSADEDDGAFDVRTFSLTTEGPTHDLWAHYRVGAGEHMVWLGGYRVTNQASARALVREVARVLHWGAGELRGWVRERCVQFLGRVWG